MKRVFTGLENILVSIRQFRFSKEQKTVVLCFMPGDTRKLRAWPRWMFVVDSCYFLIVHASRALSLCAFVTIRLHVART
jgi:hypothetical protein